MASHSSPKPKRQSSLSISPTQSAIQEQQHSRVVIKQEDSENDDDDDDKPIQDIIDDGHIIDNVHDFRNDTTYSSTSRRQPRHHRSHSKTAATMSSSNSPCMFADIAYAYRLYLLDDLLAEPQEIVHDWMRNVIYISQRYRQGNSVAPIELSHEVWVMDLNTGEIISTIDTRPYNGPHCLEMDGSGAFLTACVENGGSILIDPDSGAVYDSNLSGQGSHLPSQQQLYSSPSSCSSSSQHGGSSRSSSSRDDFIAEIDLRSGKMRRRINVAQSDSSTTDGRHIAFSAPAIRFANRSSSSGLPIVNVAGDPAIEALKTRFGAKKIYATSRNVMLV